MLIVGNASDYYMKFLNFLKPRHLPGHPLKREVPLSKMVDVQKTISIFLKKIETNGI